MATRAAQAACDDAYALHDAIYATQEAQDAAMEAAQARALAAVDAAEAAAETQQKDTALLARLRYLRGKACASTADGQGSAEAETLLADAVKLDPLLVDAWNCLGECFWARGEFPLAMHTLKGALAHRRDPATLCKLSQLLRAMGAREAQKGDAQQKEKHLVEARKMAKEARARPTLVAPRNSSARATRRPAQCFGPRTSSARAIRRALASDAALALALTSQAVGLAPASQQCWKHLGFCHFKIYGDLAPEADHLIAAKKAFTQAHRLARAARAKAAAAADADGGGSPTATGSVAPAPSAAMEEEFASDDADLCVTHANTCAALEEFGDAQRLCAARPARPRNPAAQFFRRNAVPAHVGARSSDPSSASLSRSTQVRAR